MIQNHIVSQAEEAKPRVVDMYSAGRQTAQSTPPDIFATRRAAYYEPSWVEEVVPGPPRWPFANCAIMWAGLHLVASYSSE
jgi:hypothetical protein